MTIEIGNQITLDGLFTDWLATDALMTSKNTVAGYQVYGAFLNDATLGNTYVIGIDATATTDPVIGVGTVIYLNTDRNNATGYSPFGKVGAEYEVQFALDSTGTLQPYLYSVTSGGVATLLNGGAPLNYGIASNGESVELAIPQVLLTPAGGATPTSINFDTLINGAVALPGDFTNNPEYIIADPAVPPTMIGNLITLDGTFSDWPAADIVTNPANVAAGYQIYGAFLNDATLGNTYVIGIDATSATDPVIGPGATIYLNTDQNAATGYDLSFGNIGAEYEVQFAYGSNAALEPFLYSVTAAGVTTLLNGGAPLHYGFSSNGESIELAIPQTLLTPAGGAAPTSINFVALNGTQGLPSDLANNPEYTITDPATLVARTPTHKVAIVYSDTTAALYFNQTAYSDLFMAAQNQARMAGVSYDVIDESQLTNINNLIGYDAIIFPSMADVNTAQLPAIMSTLTSAVYNYHIGIITAGDFLTNDQTGAALPGNAYSNMETLLGLQRVSGGNSGAVTVTANDITNPIMKSYTAGQVIQTYPSEGYTAYQAVGGTATDVLVNQNVTGVGTLPGVVETTTGGTNVHFATTDLLGDSNLLSNAIQAVALGTQPGVTLHMSRDAGVVAVRMDMDQSQFPADVSPAGGGSGIYGTLIPILQQWNQQYDFVGSYYINIGDNPNGADPSTTNWAVSLPYYKSLLAMGSEIGTHSYTHLINPPTGTFTATTSGDTPKGSTTITLTGAPPSFAGVTVGMFVTASNGALGTNTPLPGAAGEGGSIANSQVTAVSGDTITISYVPGGFGTANDGTIADIPAGTTLTFSIPAENTNFLQTATTTNPVLSATGNPFTYAYEFQQSALMESQQLGIPIEGAAIPGANETFATDQNILPYFQSVAASGTTPGYTGYLTGGWTGVGSGYPSAIGYMSPSATDTGSLYIAPNMTFDFTEIQYQGKTVAQAEADWAAQFSALSANAAGTPVVVLPVHDYGVAAWNTTTDTGTGSPYTTAMYTSFIANAYAKNYEFLTLEELAARTVAQQKAAINYTTVGNTITATVTPDPTAPDVGGMALSVINGGTEVIQNVANWYAYNAQELFLPSNGGTFTINLGTTQDAVTHINSLPMRADLLSVTGNGLDLNFSMLGTGQIVIDLGGTGMVTPIVSGATIISDVGNQLDLSITGLGVNNVSINLEAPPTISGTVAGQTTTDQAAIAPFSKVTIADVNPGQTETLTVTLSAAANGTLSNLGAGSYNATTGVYTDTGTTAAVTASLDGLVFTPTANQVAPGQTVTTSFVITDTDSILASTTDSTTTVVATDVAVLPTISGTVAAQATTDKAAIAPFSKVTIADVNPGQTETLTVSLSAATNGTLSNLSGGTYNATTGVYTDIGTASAVTAALDGLVFTPTANQVAPGHTVTTSFVITDTDAVLASATDSTTTVVATDVAVLPTIGGTVAGQLTSDRQTITPFSKVTIADLNLGQAETLTVTLSAAANGALSDLVGGSYNATTGVYTDTGTAAQVTTALDALVFTPTINQVQVLPGQIVTTTFTVADTDTALATATDSTTTVIATDVGAPTLTVPSTATVSQGAATFIAGLSLAEVANVTGETFTVTLADTNGLLSATGTGVTGSGTTSVTITGSLATVNSDLATLSDTDATTPSDTITLNAVDSFGVAAAPQSIAVTVIPGQTFTLTTGSDTVAGGTANNMIMAKTATLTAGDNINGGTGMNTLALQGGGTFNLATPATLTNVAIITAQEGAGATAQTVTLRAGLNATVNVADPAVASPTITIIGAANSDVINLGSGNDTVTLGAGERVNSGGGNNTFKVASATLGNVTINGGTKGTNTLSVTGGGTATMGDGITGISTVQLAAATTFTANATDGLTIVGSAGADKITAGGAGQVLTGGAGANTLTGSNTGSDIFRDTAANLNGDTIANLIASDTIDIIDLSPATAVISKSTASATSTVLTLTSGTTSTKITLSGAYQGSFALAADTTGGGGTDLTFVPTANLSTVTLPTAPVTITTGPVSTTIVATAATLLPADKITGGTGTGVTNTLQLSGGGTFNLAAVTKLTNIQVIAAQEGQGSSAQTVALKAGLNATVSVASVAGGGITIIGANNTDVINLGAGNDTVTLGSGETVNGSTGTDIYNVTKSTIGNVTIKGGSGSNTLVVTGGGNATMGAKITGINAVQLAAATTFTANTTAGLQISGSSAGGDTITLGAPTQSVIAGGANETIRATAANAGASISGLGANSTLQITNGGTVALNATTDVGTVKLSAASNLTLNGMQFITATGSAGADTIKAGAINQTLSGGAGADKLIGFSGGFDTFKDTAANLNNDTIQNFVTSDTIDLTNLAFGGATVTAAASGLNTKVTVVSGATKSVFALAGTWSSSGFHLASDTATGTFLTHT